MLIKLMVLILIAAFAGLFFVSGPDGEPVLTLDDLKPEGPTIETPAETVKVYKWQDENGIWQFSNHPRDQQQGELLELDGQINTIPAPDTSGLQTTTATPSPRPKLSVPDGMTSLSSAQMENMMDTVNNLQQTVDERKKDMDRMTSGQP